MGLDQEFRVRQRGRDDYEELAYFRKVNFLHGFIETVVLDNQPTNTDDIALSTDVLKDLIHRCESVLANHNRAPLLLPTREGFFFGNYNYDEWYFKDVQNVLDAARKALAMQLEGAEVVYWSWW